MQKTFSDDLQKISGWSQWYGFERGNALRVEMGVAGGGVFGIIGSVIGAAIAGPAGIIVGAGVGMLAGTAAAAAGVPAAVNLHVAAKKRKDCAESLESFTLQGVKMKYKTIIDTEWIEYKSKDAYQLEILGYEVSLIDEKQKKNKIYLDKHEFDKYFNIVSITNKWALEGIDSYVEEIHSKEEDIDKQWNRQHVISSIEESLNELNAVSGLEGICELQDNSCKIFVGKNTFDRSKSDYVMFLASENTTKPNLSHPIAIKDKETVLGELLKLKK